MRKFILALSMLTLLQSVLVNAEVVVYSKEDIEFTCRAYFPFQRIGGGGGISPKDMEFQVKYPAGKALFEFDRDGFTKIVPAEILDSYDTTAGATFGRVLPDSASKTAMFYVIGGYNQQGVETKHFYHMVRVSAYAGTPNDPRYLGEGRMYLNGIPNFEGEFSFSFIHPSDPTRVMNELCKIKSLYK